MNKEKLKTQGWEIITSGDLVKFDQTESLIIKSINKILKLNKKNIRIKNIFDLKKNNSYLNYNIVNQIRQVYISDFAFQLTDIFSKRLNYLFGKDIFVQKFPTLRIHMGKKSVTSLSPHTELMAGLSPYTFNLWIPFHNIEDSKGIWIIDIKDSLKIFKIYKYLKPNELMLKIKKSKSFQFIHLKKGQSILFNSFIFHGNDHFSADDLRVSADVRIQKYNSPFLFKSSEYFSYQKLK